MKRSTRREIARDTLKILKNGYFTNKNEEEINISKAQRFAEANTILYTPDRLESLINSIPNAAGEFETSFEVNALTTLDSVRTEYAQEQKIICLNFASARNPGGGFLNGSQAQEESIARATGLYPCQLKAENYYKKNRLITTCLYTNHMIYSPKVPILKNEDGELLDTVNYCSVITAPAVNTGVVLRNEPENIDKIEPYMRKRIEMVLAICKENEYEVLVLGAWGCGVFRNDPVVVATMFYELLNGKYRNHFKKVVFSIYSKNEKFITPFQELFD